MCRKSDEEFGDAANPDIKLGKNIGKYSHVRISKYICLLMTNFSSQKNKCFLCLFISSILSPSISEKKNP